MSDTLLVGIVAAGVPVVIAVFGFAVAWLDRRAKDRTAEAANTAADASDKAAHAANTAAGAAAEEARAQMRKAIVAERDQASADWARYTQAMQKWNESLAAQIADNNRRITEAEMRTEAAELRATQAEKKLAFVVIYLRRVIDWVNENLPGESLPPMPPWLESDLDL